MATSKDLIKIVDEGNNEIVEFGKMGELKGVLNQEPNRNWIKNHPFAKDVRYLPIDKVETMLDMIFQQWRVEVLSISQLAQSICCTIRLHYLNPVTKEWSFHDGIGAVPLKTDKGFSASDLAHIKSDAVATGAPAAKSFAIKDAAEHLGKLFGRDLNRKDAVAYQNLYDVPEDTDWAGELDKATNLAELYRIWLKVPKELQEELKEYKDRIKNKFVA